MGNNMWIELTENKDTKYLMNLDKVDLIRKEEDKIRVRWTDGDVEIYNINYESILIKLQEAKILKW